MFQEQDAEQRLCRRIEAIEDHRFGRVRQCSHRVVGLVAQIGTASAQARVIRKLCDSLVQFAQRQLRASFPHGDAGSEFSDDRRGRRKAPHGRQQLPRCREAIRPEQGRDARRERAGVGGSP